MQAPAECGGAPGSQEGEGAEERGGGGEAGYGAEASQGPAAAIHVVAGGQQHQHQTQEKSGETSKKTGSWNIIASHSVFIVRLVLGWGAMVYYALMIMISYNYIITMNPSIKIGFTFILALK